MKNCKQCGTTIIFGAVKGPNGNYCTDDCLAIDMQNEVLAHVPDDVINNAITSVHQGNCPNCDGPGPVDLRTSYRVWSLLVVSTYSSHPQICCRSCGVKAKITDIFFCVFLGWWSFSGLLMTPVQIGRNIWGILFAQKDHHPSPMLGEIMRANVAENIAQDNFYEQPLPEVPVFGPGSKSEDDI